MCQSSGAVWKCPGGRRGLPGPNGPYGLCGRKATLNLNSACQSSGAVWKCPGGRRGLPGPNGPYGLCGRKATLNLNSACQSSGAVWKCPGGRRGLPGPNGPYGLCGRKATQNLNSVCRSSGAVWKCPGGRPGPPSPSLKSPDGFCGRKAALKRENGPRLALRVLHLARSGLSYWHCPVHPHKRVSQSVATWTSHTVGIDFHLPLQEGGGGGGKETSRWAKQVERWIERCLIWFILKHPVSHDGCTSCTREDGF